MHCPNVVVSLGLLLVVLLLLLLLFVVVPLGRLPQLEHWHSGVVVVVVVVVE